MKKRIIVSLFVFVMFSLFACKDKYDEPADTFSAVAQSGCISCHMDKELLIAVADPLPDTGGEGGEG